MFAVHETPAEVFSRVFRKELKEASYSHKESGEPSISQAEFDSLLRNVELSEEGQRKRSEQNKVSRRSQRRPKDESQGRIHATADRSGKASHSGSEDCRG